MPVPLMPPPTTSTSTSEGIVAACMLSFWFEWVRFSRIGPPRQAGNRAVAAHGAWPTLATRRPVVQPEASGCPYSRHDTPQPEPTRARTCVAQLHAQSAAERSAGRGARARRVDGRGNGRTLRRHPADGAARRQLAVRRRLAGTLSRWRARAELDHREHRLSPAPASE